MLRFCVTATRRLDPNRLTTLIAGATLLLAACSGSPAGFAPPTPTQAAPTVTPVVLATPTLVAATPIPVAATSVPAAVPDQELSPEDQAATARLEAYLSDLADRKTFSGAVLVARDGIPLVSRGIGLADRAQASPNTPQTRFRLGSLTKQFTALAVLLLEERGLLDLQDPICGYIVDCPPAWHPITIHQLLSHTAGIPDLTRFPDFERTKATPSPLPSTIARFRDQPLDFAPGSRWNYSNSNYILLGYLIEQVSGQDYATFLRDNIFAPLRMQDSGYEDANSGLAVGYAGSGDRPADLIDLSIPHAAGALYSTAEDMLRWDQALYTEQLAPATEVARLFTPYAPIPGEDGFSYAYGWMVGEEFRRPVASHSGGIEGFSANIRRYVDDHVTIIVLSNQQDINPNALGQDLSRILFSPGP